MKIIRGIALVAAVALLLIALGGCSGDTENKEIKSFALCLTKNDVTLYGRPDCPACQKQRGMFKDEFEYVNYVDCSSSEQLCSRKNIGKVPTWEIDGQRFTRVLSIQELSRLSECNFEGELE